MRELVKPEEEVGRYSLGSRAGRSEEVCRVIQPEVREVSSARKRVLVACAGSTATA